MPTDVDKNHYPPVLNLPQSQFHGILDSLPDATLVLNKDGKIVFASKQVEQTFGYTPNELFGLTVEELMPENYRHQHVKHRQSYFNNPRFRNPSFRPIVSGLEFYGQRKDGTIFPAEISLGHFENGHGTLVISTVRDVTKQRQIEQLEVSDWRLQLILKHAPLGIAFFDKDMNYQFVSNRWLEDYRLVGRDIIGLNHYEVFPELAEHWKDVHRRCLDGEFIQVEEDIFPRADGQIDWLRWQCQPWRDSNGAVGGIVLFTQLITSRKRMQVELGKSEEHIRKIYENAMTGIALIDLSGKFAHCNAAFSSLLGYPLAELRELKFMDLIYPEDLEEMMFEIARLQTEKLPYLDIINRCVKKNGEPIWVRKNVTLLFDEYGQPEYYLAIVNDNTRIRAAEEALKSSHENLESQVFQRTQELEQAKHLAEDANAFKTRFLTAASHDLRQPLQSAELYLSVLSQMEGSTQHVEICNAMQQSLDAMCDILNALLDISKFQSGVITANKKDFILDTMLNRIVTANLQQAQAKGLILACQAQHCLVHSDQVLLERIVENFVTNAIRYTQEGHILIDCETEGDKVSISVSDTGIGIPASELDNIFNEYYQIGNPGRDRRKGLGIGLAIAKYISQILGHPLIVKSTPGLGSVFTVTVPLGEASKMNQGATSQEPNQDGFQQKPEVIFIEDDPMIARAMKLFFDRKGIPVHTVENGEEAIAQIRSGLRPDIIISDYRLPGCNGIDTVKQIRELALDEIPAIIISGDTSMRHIEDGNLPKCTVFLKPVDTKKMMAAIYEATKIKFTRLG